MKNLTIQHNLYALIRRQSADLICYTRGVVSHSVLLHSLHFSDPLIFTLYAFTFFSLFSLFFFSKKKKLDSRMNYSHGRGKQRKQVGGVDLSSIMLIVYMCCVCVCVRSVGVVLFLSTVYSHGLIALLPHGFFSM